MRRNRSVIILWVCVAGESLASLGIAGSWAYQSCCSADGELVQFRALASQVQQVVQLRAGLPGRENRTRTDFGLAPRFSAVLTGCGLPASALSSVSADPEPVPIGGELSIKRRRASVTLTAVTLPQVGSLLASWREREPGWTVTGIDLTPETAAPVAPGGDLPLRVLIAMESLLVDENGGAR